MYDLMTITDLHIYYICISKLIVNDLLLVQIYVMAKLINATIINVHLLQCIINLRIEYS